MSVTMGWTEPPPTTRRESSALVGNVFPMRAPIAERHMSLAIPDYQYRTEAASKRFTRRQSLRAGRMNGQEPPTDSKDAHESALAEALAALEGSSIVPTSARDKSPRLSAAVPPEITPQNMKRMSLKAVQPPSCPQISDTNRPGLSKGQPSSQQAETHAELHSPTQCRTLFDDRKDDSEDRAENDVEIPPLQTTDVTSRRTRRMSTKRISLYLKEKFSETKGTPTNISESSPSQWLDGAVLDGGLDPLEAEHRPRQEKSLSASFELLDNISRTKNRKSLKRYSQFMDDDILEMEEMPMINFQDNPSQVDPAALEDALAALEGTHGPRQESHGSELTQTTPRRMKRMSAKRVSLFLDDNIPEAVESESLNTDDTPAVPDNPRPRKASVEYALAALEAPTPNRANIGKPRRPNAAARSRKTMSMYTETGPRSMSPRATNPAPEPRSFFEIDSPETQYESTSRKLKRMSWNVMGRALPQLRQTDDASHVSSKQNHLLHAERPEQTSRKSDRASWLTTARAIPEPLASLNHEPSVTASAFDQSSLDAQALRHFEPVPRKTNRSSWYSMDPTVAEIQCSPRREYGAPAPWLEPVVQPTHELSPASGGLLRRKAKRASWYPMAREVEPGLPDSFHEISPTMASVPEGSVEDAKLRKKINRMSRFVFPQGPKKTVPPFEIFPQLNGPLNSHPASSIPSRPETPIRPQPKSRMRKLGVQIGRLFR